MRTPISRHQEGDRTTFSWSTEGPPLDARYRLEWRFKAPGAEDVPTERAKPSAQMQALGIVEDDDPLLREVARPFDLPEDAEDARRVIAQLQATMERVGQSHNFAKGMGLAAPQINIARPLHSCAPLPGSS